MEDDVAELDSLSELRDKNNTEVMGVSLDLLPDDLIERIITYLPIASIIRAGCVSRKWYDIVCSTSFLRNLSNSISHKPWYFMLISSYKTNVFANSKKKKTNGYVYDPILRNGYAYDPILRKRYRRIGLRYIESTDWFKASSGGLVCFMDYDSRTKLYVCNPITRCYKKLKVPPEFKFSCHTALAISVNRVSHKYIVTLVESKRVPDTFSQCVTSIHVYDSVSMRWKTPITELLTNWDGDNESVICDGVLYFLIYKTGGGGYDRHNLIAYNLSSTPSNGSLIKNTISVPCSLTWVSLMNLNENLVLVGGIGLIEDQIL